MTVTLCVTTATMPGFKNSTDLDEVHSLSRYCFLYSSLGGLRLLFKSCCAKSMYQSSCFFTLSSTQGYRSRTTNTSSSRPKELLHMDQMAHFS